jgi:hypothetical protein
MTKRGRGQTQQPIDATDADTFERRGAFKQVGGSQSDAWNTWLADQTVRAMTLNASDEAEQDRQLRASVAALRGIAPNDELEGMMAAQLIAAHHAAMDCYRFATLPRQTSEGRRAYLDQANKLSRTWATLLAALDKHRGKGQQKVTVEHVHVHAGAQAVVGMIETPGGGDRGKSEEQPHAKRLAHAPQPTLRCADEERHAVPVAGDDERPLPHARGRLARRTDR